MATSSALKSWVAALSQSAGVLLPSVCFLLIAGVLLTQAHLRFTGLTDPQSLQSLGLVTAICAIALVASYAARQLLIPSGRDASAPLVRATPVSGDGEGNRDRLARYVVVGGTLGIATIALAVIIGIYVSISDATAKERDTLNIFTSILPVFSTWVGTVLAFYFTNESYRQASAAASAQSANSEPVTRPGTMVPYERIVRFDMDTAQLAGRDPQIAAADLPLDPIRKYFNPPGISRVIIFDDRKVPVFILRHDGLPPLPPNPPLAGQLPQTLKDYLDAGANRASARNFAWTSSTATIADALRLLQIRKVQDIFVTQHGLSDEPTLGWVPDTNLNTGAAGTN